MKAIRVLLLQLLHLACTLVTQAVLLRLLLGEGEISPSRCLAALAVALAVAAADAVCSSVLLRGNTFRHLPYLVLEFWDLFLISPLLLLSLVSLFSGAEGRSFGFTAMGMDLLLIIGRSVSFVLCDPERRRDKRGSSGRKDDGFPEN